MPPQPFEFRLDSLERRVTPLEQLPDHIDDLTSQVSHLRTEMRGEFSAVRTEMAEQGASLRREIRDLAMRMLVLHEEVISRIALLQEGWSRPRRRQSRELKPEAGSYRGQLTASRSR